MLRATHKAVAAVAVGPCVLGDKDDIAKTAMLNADHAVDLAELGGDDGSGEGSDMLYEIKVPSALIASYCAGKGSQEGGGAPASVGHKYGFGSTEEEYDAMCYGCRERGRQRDGPLDHDTGKGWVKGKKGHYDDAIVRKRTRLCVMLVENTGGITLRGRRQLGVLSERAKGRGATDRTKYGSTRGSPTSYYVHHTQQISKAAVLYDAMAIRKQILSLRQRLCTNSAAQAAPAGGAQA